MARDFDQPARNYTPNADGSPREFGPFSVDSLTENDTDFLLLTITPDGAWPTASPLVTGSVLWSDGSGSGFELNAPHRDRAGNVLPAYTHRFDVRRLSGRRKSVIASGTISLIVHAACRVAVSLVPGIDP